MNGKGTARESCFLFPFYLSHYSSCGIFNRITAKSFYDRIILLKKFLSLTGLLLL